MGLSFLICEGVFEGNSWGIKESCECNFECSRGAQTNSLSVRGMSQHLAPGAVFVSMHRCTCCDLES